MLYIQHVSQEQSGAKSVRRRNWCAVAEYRQNGYLEWSVESWNLAGISSLFWRECGIFFVWREWSPVLRRNIDSRQSIRAFRIFKENGGKRIPPELRPLLLALKTIPVCTTECERGFSQMNLIISRTRNSMLVSTASCLMFGKLVGPSLARFDPLPYVRSWIAWKTLSRWL